MPLKDRFRRLRKGSISADNSPPSASTPDAGLSTGEATPAVTRTPTTQSYTDLTTIGEVLTQQATLKAQADGKKKKGLFRWKKDPYKDWPSDVYRPHEVPAPKYKRKPDPQHIENLSSFSFGNGASNFMRRFSQQTDISPGGSKMASRAGSRMNSIAPSRVQSTAPSQDPSRNTSIADDKEDSGVGSPSKEKTSRPVAGSRGVSRGLVKSSGEPAIGKIGEDDENEMTRQKTAEQDGEDKLDTAKTQSRGSNDMPFTQHELTQALNKVSVSN